MTIKTVKLLTLSFFPQSTNWQRVAQQPFELANEPTRQLVLIGSHTSDSTTRGGIIEYGTGDVK